METTLGLSLSPFLTHRAAAESFSSFLPLPSPHPLLLSPPLPPHPPLFRRLSSDLTSSLSTCSSLSPSLSLLPCSRTLTSLACTKHIHHLSMSPHLVPPCFLYLGVLQLSVYPNRTKRILTVSAYLSICARCKEGSPLLGAHLELWAVLGEGIMGY